MKRIRTKTMNRSLAPCVALLLAPLALVHAAPAVAQAPLDAKPEQKPTPLDFAVKARIDEFLGEPKFVPKQRLFEGRGGWGGVLTATDGTVIAFRSPASGTCRRSLDGGLTWGNEIVIGSDANEGNALIDETTGDILYFNTVRRWLYRSRDAGATWIREAIEVRPDGFGLEPGKEGVAAMQCGITLAFGKHRGRLISPARIMGPRDSNAVEWRAYHYSTAIWSDDGGRVWQTSKPFPCSAPVRRHSRSSLMARSSTTLVST